MEYCTIALNEASNSGCSNRFDFSLYNGSVWLLGQLYELPENRDELIEDIRSKLWITYRKNFPPLDENTRYTTDRGFGCMIRCGQMVLANALVYKNLGRKWRWSPKSMDCNPEVYAKILNLFLDREDCLYSIHRIVQTGQIEGKTVGEWFGPNTIAQALKRLSLSYRESGETTDETSISIDVALDNVVVIDEIKAKFKSKSKIAKKTRGSGDDKNQNEQNSAAANSTTIIKNDINQAPKPRHETATATTTTTATALQTPSDLVWSPGVLFIQLRLGLTKINPLYFAALKKTFQFKNSLGIIGGRPNHALYLVGFTEDDVIYLDPHNTQQYISPEQGTLDDSTYHCLCPERMPIDRLDPSLALCFFFESEDDFDGWCEASKDLLVKSERTPMFEVSAFRRAECDLSELGSGLLEEFDMNDDGCLLEEIETGEGVMPGPVVGIAEPTSEFVVSE